MRLAFMGSPGFAVPVLRALHTARHEIAAVYCQPPKPAGRGHSVRPCAVQVEAERLGLAVRTPARLRDNTEARAAFAALHPIGRIGTPKEVAEAVLWLCSERSSFVTGHSLLVDGSFTAQ